jgi:hypothetical protein
MTAVRPMRIEAFAAASLEEAAAIVTALERFMRATATPPACGEPVPRDAWHTAAVLEGVAQDPWAAVSDPALPSPWINT